MAGRPRKTAEDAKKMGAVSFRVPEPEKEKIEKKANQMGYDESAPFMRQVVKAVNNMGPAELIEFMRLATRTHTRVPIANTIRAGLLTLTDGSIEPMGFLVTDAELPSRVAALRVVGDSMSNGSWQGGGIQDGDFVIIGEGEVQSGDIAAIQTEDEKATLKRVSFRTGDNKIRLRALNPTYEDQFVDAKGARLIKVHAVIPGADAVVEQFQ